MKCGIAKPAREIDALSLLAEGLSFDFSSKGMDEPARLMSSCLTRSCSM
jgi:hypothetical protein